MVDIHFAEGGLRCVAVERLEREWLGSEIWIRGRAYRLAECEILVAEHGEGLLAYDVRDRPIAELVAVNAFKRYQGIGTALLNCLVRRLRANGFATIRLATTNDNLDLQNFYVKEHADNFMMHLLVANVEAWWSPFKIISLSPSMA